MTVQDGVKKDVVSVHAELQNDSRVYLKQSFLIETDKHEWKNILSNNNIIFHMDYIFRCVCMFLFPLVHYIFILWVLLGFYFSWSYILAMFELMSQQDVILLSTHCLLLIFRCFRIMLLH